VPEETETAVNRALKDISPIRAIAGVRQVSGSVYRKPFAVTGAESGWVAETGTRDETDSPTLAALSEMSFPTMELYAMPAATSALLDDSAVNIDEWIAEEVRLPARWRFPPLRLPPHSKKDLPTWQRPQRHQRPNGGASP